MKKTNEIKRYLEATMANNLDVPEALLQELRQDQRQTIIKLLERYERYQKKKADALQYWQKFRAYEIRLASQELLVAGIDEAGRGPLAGPVVAAAVILPSDCCWTGLKDSKQLSPIQRERLYNVITAEAVSWAVGLANVDEIEQYNILGATQIAMLRAIEQLNPQPDYLLIDAITLPDWKGQQEGIIDGDASHACIAAASVIAKVTRDRMMQEFAQLYPQYGFDQHKGYGTAAHIAALQTYGPCPQHRWSFIRKFMIGV